MSRAVWKAPLALALAVDDGGQAVNLPEGAKPISFQMQGTTPVVWFDVDNGASHATRFIELFGTGMPIPGDAQYIGTIQLDHGSLVLHAFEVFG